MHFYEKKWVLSNISFLDANKNFVDKVSNIYLIILDFYHIFDSMTWHSDLKINAIK